MLAAHQTTAALSAGLLLHAEDRKRGQLTAWPIAGAGAAALATNVPDVLEPALAPNHRQFFHSCSMAHETVARAAVPGGYRRAPADLTQPTNVTFEHAAVAGDSLLGPSIDP
ncbi:MAG: hypothetical protein ACRETD_02730 [Steroidobacteraceae bacterium]